MSSTPDAVAEIRVICKEPFPVLRAGCLGFRGSPCRRLQERPHVELEQPCSVLVIDVGEPRAGTAASIAS